MTRSFGRSRRCIADHVILVLLVRNLLQTRQQIIGVDDHESARPTRQLIQDLLICRCARRKRRNDEPRLVHRVVVVIRVVIASGVATATPAATRTARSAGASASALPASSAGSPGTACAASTTRPASATASSSTATYATTTAATRATTAPSTTNSSASSTAAPLHAHQVNATPVVRVEILKVQSSCLQMRRMVHHRILQ